MKQLKLFSGVLACLPVLILLTGCATTVDLRVQRLPSLNTLGIQRLAVMPFSTTNRSSLQRQAAAYLMNESLARIQATSHFTLVSASEIEWTRSAGGNIEELADALFSGQLISTSVQDSSREASYQNKEGETITYTIYSREAQISFNYYLTRTRDGSMIGPINKSASAGDSDESPINLLSAEALVQRMIQQQMAGLGRDLAPYMAIERRSFMKETSKDKIIKQRAKDADTLVKAGNYKSAYDAFMGIYTDTGSFPAAYNAALLIEVMGDLEGAAAFMQRVEFETGNPRAAVEIARLQQAMYNEGLLEAYTANTSQRDRIIALMVESLPASLPESPRVALINNANTEKDLTETIINGIIDGFISKGIPVIDRNNRSLMEMERNYQYSGNVSDEEMVSIGHEAGVNTFILVAVSGSGAGRRLSVRMIDVERSTVLYQSPQTDAMNL